MKYAVRDLVVRINILLQRFEPTTRKRRCACQQEVRVERKTSRASDGTTWLCGTKYL